MSYTINSVAHQIHDILSEDPGPAGRERIRSLLEKALIDESFIRETVGPDNDKARQVLYEDSELGFCICAHVYKGVSESKPHDHGPSWAIYGQAVGETEMIDWSFVEKPEGDNTGTVKAEKVYRLVPGDAHLYNEGYLHSPSRKGENRLIRIEGMNMDSIKRIWHVPA